jgi:hypothetical protein
MDMRGIEAECKQDFGGKPDWRRPLERHGYKWEGTIRMAVE